MWHLMLYGSCNDDGHFNLYIVHALIYFVAPGKEMGKFDLLSKG